MLLPAYIRTAPGREDILAGTLARWEAAGCGAGPLIQCGPGLRFGHGLGRIMAAWRWLPEQLVDSWLDFAAVQ